MPKIKNKVLAAKIIDDNKWQFIGEKIYFDGKWVKIDYYVITSSIIPPRGSYLSGQLKASINIRHEQIA